MPVGADPARAHRFAQLLRDQGFEVQQAADAVTVGTRTLAAGTYVVPAAQPAGRLLQNLLDPAIAQPEAFVKEQDRLRKKRLPDQMYDVTGWHLPSAYDVEVVAVDRPLTTLRTRAVAAPTAITLPPARVGYLMPWGLGTASLVVAAQKAGVRVRFAGKGFTLGGRAYPAGTAIVRTSENGEDLASVLTRLAAEHHAEVVTADSAYTEDGISLGSGRVVALRAPRVLLAWDAPTSSQSAGWARYVLERRFGQRVTAVRVSAFMMADLTRFDVVVLPSGNYQQGLNGPALQRLKDWVSAGGTLITIAEASRWATRDGVNLLDTTTELRDGRPEGGAASGGSGGGSGAGRPAGGGSASTEAGKPLDLEKATLPKDEPPFATSGALVKANLDREHWLAAGTDGDIHGMVEGSRVFTPITLDKGRNVATWASGDDAVAAGLVWPEAKAQLANKAAVIAQSRGRGHVIAFAEDPNFRAFTEGTELLFMNAVLLGPAH